MSQKSSLPQPTQTVSLVLTADSRRADQRPRDRLVESKRQLAVALGRPFQRADTETWRKEKRSRKAARKRAVSGLDCGRLELLCCPVELVGTQIPANIEESVRLQEREFLSFDCVLVGGLGNG